MFEEEITPWLGKLQAADQGAAEAIWEGYFEKLTRLARRKLGDLPKRSADEEDIALSAMNSFFRGAAAGKFPRLEDRTDLWKLLVTITARKAVAERRRQFAQKRGGNRVSGESAFSHDPNNSRVGGIGQVLGSEPSPELAALMAETCGDLLETLKQEDESLQAVALYKMEGFTNEEIADRLGRSCRTVERKLERIRCIWSETTS